MKYIFYINILLTISIQAQTEDQIKRAKDYINSNKISKSEARSIAKSKGYSDEQIDEVIAKEKIKKTNLKDNTEVLETTNVKPESEKQGADFNLSNTLNEDNASNEDNNLDEEEIIDQYDVNKTSMQELTYFGYDIFKGDPALFQATSVGIVDPSYIIGAGDEIVLLLWGETQFRLVLLVDREGFVFIPEIGQVFVNGLNLKLLQSKLFRVLSQSYASLNPVDGQPSTFLDISLGKLRPLRIQVLGEVDQPGAYTVSPSATLFSALYYFNGPTTLGSLRKINLIRNEKEIATIDFYDYLLTGKKPKDQKLQLDDVIYIPNRLKTVTIKGEINRPGIYELKSDESLKDLLKMAGGLKITAYLDRAQIDRIVPFEKRNEIGMDRMYTDIDLDEVMNTNKLVSLQDGDVIQVFSVLETRQNVVTIQGAVSRPGSYDLGDSMNLKELIIKADSLLGDAYMERVDIVRVKSDYTEKLIKLDLNKVMLDSEEENIELKSQDRVRIYGIQEMVPKTYVSIQGHVKRPGRVTLQENMTLYDLIFKTGGFSDPEFKKSTYLKRSELIRLREDNGEKEIIPFNLGLVLDKSDKAEILLKSNDIIRIYSLVEIEGSNFFVSIDGHVKRPGRYELFESNMMLYDLLFKAGGFDDPLFKANTFLDRADLFRFDEKQKAQIIIQFNLGQILNDKNNKQNIKLKPGDYIKVYSNDIYNFSYEVAIKGSVNNPGSYRFKKGMTLEDLILESGGIKGNIFEYKIEIARFDPAKINEDNLAEIIFVENLKIDEITSKTVVEDIDKKLQISSLERIKLRPYDEVFIRPDMFKQFIKTVSVTGEVHYPGEYTLKNSEERIFDLIKRAGGMKKNAYPFASLFYRSGNRLSLDIEKIMKNPKRNDNIILYPSDSLVIVKKPNVVSIQGEVNSPGFYSYKPGIRMKKFIDLAGGLSQEANVEDIYIRYPNGDSKKYSRWLANNKVYDGSIIIIGQKEPEEPFDKTEYFKELTNIFANIAQVISMLIIAS